MEQKSSLGVKDKTPSDKSEMITNVTVDVQQKRKEKQT